MQEVIVLVGLPGSGKTTLTNEFPEHVRVSQDVLGNRQLCIDACHEALSSGKSVIVDRTNIDAYQRNHWINVAKYYGVKVRCIYLEADTDECVSRIHLRKNHETIKSDMSLEEKQRIVNMFSKKLQVPILDEGFYEIILRKG